VSTSRFGIGVRAPIRRSDLGPGAKCVSRHDPTPTMGRTTTVLLGFAGRYFGCEEGDPRAKPILTEIKVAEGLSDRHASVLAALRIRLKGSAGKSLEEMLEAAGDLKPDALQMDECAWHGAAGTARTASSAVADLMP
jgi:hypothetical protein